MRCNLAVFVVTTKTRQCPLEGKSWSIPGLNPPPNGLPGFCGGLPPVYAKYRRLSANFQQLSASF
jgi:hypothetical protein